MAVWVPVHIFGRWPEVEGRLRMSLGLFLMLDYDGTLVYDVGRPEAVELSPEVRGVLEGLARRGWVKVAMFSGRTVEQLRRLVGVRGLFYAGLHGLNIVGPGLSFTHDEAPELRRRVESVEAELKEALKGFKEVSIEDRGLSLSIHYELAPRGFGRQVSKVLNPILSRHAGLRAFKGRKAIELTPEVDWDRGRAALTLLEAAGAQDYVPLYVGNDKLDEPAFKALSGRGLTVVVGRKRRSYAGFYVRSVEEVHELLKRISALASL